MNPGLWLLTVIALSLGLLFLYDLARIRRVRRREK